MSDSPFVAFYTSDFLGGTSGMTAAVKGVYITLLCLMYESEAPLPQSWETLARRCGCTLPAFRKAIASLQDDAKISVSDDGIWSEKCDKHIATRRERRNSATAAAKKRWEKTKEKQGEGDATAIVPQCKPEPEPYIREEPKGSLSSGDDAPPDATPHVDEIAEAVTAYNLAAAESGWPQVRILSKARRSALSQRLRECDGIDGWRDALRRAQDSPHCCGQNERGWTANFDFLTRQSSFAKLMEGNYDARPNHAGNRSIRNPDTIQEILAAARAR